MSLSCHQRISLSEDKQNQPGPGSSRDPCTLDQGSVGSGGRRHERGGRWHSVSHLSLVGAPGAQRARCPHPLAPHSISIPSLAAEVSQLKNGMTSLRNEIILLFSSERFCNFMLVYDNFMLSCLT